MSTDPRHRRQAQQLSLIAHQAARLHTLLREAYTAIELTLPDGYPSGGGEPVSGGDIGNPTLGAVLEHERVLESIEDHGADEARRVGLAAVDTSLAVAVNALREVHAELTQITARLHAGHEAQRTNMAECQACERTVANTPKDRLPLRLLHGVPQGVGPRRPPRPCRLRADPAWTRHHARARGAHVRCRSRRPSRSMARPCACPPTWPSSSTSSSSPRRPTSHASTPPPSNGPREMSPHRCLMSPRNGAKIARSSAVCLRATAVVVPRSLRCQQILDTRDSGDSGSSRESSSATAACATCVIGPAPRQRTMSSHTRTAAASTTPTSRRRIASATRSVVTAASAGPATRSPGGSQPRSRTRALGTG
jgi:hypothetical protein